MRTPCVIMKLLARHVTSFMTRPLSESTAVRRTLCSSAWGSGTEYTHHGGHPRPILARGISSWQDLLKWEKNQWRTESGKYRHLAATFKKRLNVMHRKEPVRTQREMIRHGAYLYFEDNGCISRFHQNLGEESLEVLLHSEDFGHPDYQIQRIRISPGQSFLAVVFKSLDREESTCVIQKLGNKPQVIHCIQNIHSIEWVTDSILYHTMQENLHCHHVYQTDFSNACATKLVYTEQDSRFFVDLYLTRDKRFLTINSNSKNTSEVRLVDVRCPLETPLLVQQRVPETLYHVEHRDGCLYILTTYGESAEYKLMKASIPCPMESWGSLYEIKPNVKLVDMEMLQDHCVMFLKCENQPCMDIISLCTEKVIQSIKLPAWACTFEPDHYNQYGNASFSFYLASPIQRPILFVYSLTEDRLLLEDSYDAADQEVYRTQRFQAESQDGTLVPITVFYKASHKDLRQKPLLIHVYGAYGMDMNMSFKAEKRLLAEDDWILAYCHVRGGGELGCNWHKEGILGKKQNGLHDLCACISHLHEAGFSRPKSTAIEASSGGGVLAGALYNTRPEVFNAMVLEAPFLDLLNTMMDISLPLTVEEQEEWGDPTSNIKCREYIKMYCPYQNIKPQHYPSALITAYESDQRIPLEGLLNYTDRLRKAAHIHCHSTNTPVSQMPTILLDVQPGGSHCDSLSWEDSLRKVAMHLAFLYKELKLEERKFPLTEKTKWR
uniref:Prolyl endopeptidase n=1 Tax=Leptobrachium leishanense TaxID=445787 RepID=A0A8C5MCH7_9ANUR